MPSKRLFGKEILDASHDPRLENLAVGVQKKRLSCWGENGPCVQVPCRYHCMVKPCLFFKLPVCPCRPVRPSAFCSRRGGFDLIIMISNIVVSASKLSTKNLIWQIFCSILKFLNLKSNIRYRQGIKVEFETYEFQNITHQPLTSLYELQNIGFYELSSKYLLFLL
jgi:hypothetical protein